MKLKTVCAIALSITLFVPIGVDAEDSLSEAERLPITTFVKSCIAVANGGEGIEKFFETSSHKANLQSMGSRNGIDAWSIKNDVVKVSVNREKRTCMIRSSRTDGPAQLAMIKSMLAAEYTSFELIFSKSYEAASSQRDVWCREETLFGSAIGLSVVSNLKQTPDKAVNIVISAAQSSKTCAEQKTALGES